MITVLLGTNPYPFTRLLSAIDKWAGESGEQVVAQIGYTSYRPENIETHNFVAHTQILSWLDQSNVLICQGGFGSIMDCLGAKKPTIVVPRLQRLGESPDDQSELVAMLAARGLVISLDEMTDLDSAIRASKSMIPPNREESRIPTLVAEAVKQSLARQ